MRIRDFQEIIRKTYYERDKQKGIKSVFIWTIEEVGELAKSLNRKTKEDIKLEVSDVIAWIFSIANLLDIDIEEALERYFNGCPKCKSMPCVCKMEVNFEGT
ncbi:MAG: MazG nucleotide pyrophosphohydrolase domain-containing protein [candidate division WOR-3 bacterium]